MIIEVIPELELIIGKQPEVPDLSGSAAQNRFDLLFTKFVQVFTARKHPLVLFLDDLQWADATSLKLLKLLMTQASAKPGAGHLLLLGAYRNNEVFPAHPLMLTLHDIEKQSTSITTLPLAALSETDITHWVADTLLCSPKVVQPLSQLVYQKAKGNPFFTTQFLKELHRQGCIVFDGIIGCWCCDIAQARQLALTDDVVAFMVERLKTLPPTTQTVLKLAACIGNCFDLATLSLVCKAGQDTVASHLWQGLQEGFISSENEIYKFFHGEQHGPKSTQCPDGVTAKYRFLHDRVQQAAYMMIPASEKAITHLKIGQLLLQGLPPSEQNEQVFAIVSQLNLGRAKIEIDSGGQIQYLARLNYQAGQKAKLSAAYEAALRYFDLGIDLLPPGTWKTHYELIYNLYREAAEVAYLCGAFDRAEDLYATALAHANTILDQARIYRIQVTQYQLQGYYTKAISIQRQSLALLGWQLPEEKAAIQANLEAEIATVDQFLAESTIDSILALPKMESESLAEILQLLPILFYAAWQNGQTNLAFLALAKMTTLSLRYGNGAPSPFGYVGYGMIANNILGNPALAYEFGKMAVLLCEQFDNADVRGMTNFLFAADVHSWSRPLREADTYYDNAYHYGIESGNWLTVGFMMIQSGSDRLTYCRNLMELYETAQSHAEFLRHVKSLDNLDALQAGVIQPIRNLLGLTKTPFTFDDDTFSEASYCQQYRNDPYFLSWLYSVKIRHAYLFNQVESYDQALSMLNTIESAIPSHAKVPSSVFYVALIYLSLVERDTDEQKRQDYWQIIQDLEEKLNNWQIACPENIAHKTLLVKAEKARLQANPSLAIGFYDQAISHAHAHKYLYEEALANELTAKFYIARGKKAIAAGYMQEAYNCYAGWGAKAKTDQLEAHYAHLLAPVLPPLSEPPLAWQPATELNAAVTCTSTTKVFNLDFHSVLKASQTISREIELGALIKKLMHILLENAGATRGVIMLDIVNSQKAINDVNIENFQSLLVNFEQLDELANSIVPKTVVNTVRHNQQTIVVDLQSANHHFAKDTYFARHRPQSFCCKPVLNRGKLIGILYLENYFTAGAFTQTHLATLDFITAQAAISIDNACLYASLEERNHSLSQMTVQLQASFEQMKALNGVLAENESRLQQFFEALPVGTAVYDPTGKLNYVNKVGKTLLKLDSIPECSSEQLGQAFQINTSKGQDTYPTESFPAAKALSGEVFHSEEMELCQSGQTIPVEVWASPIFNDVGEIVYAIVAFQDISDRKRAEATLIHNALHDSPTNLPNRNLLLEQIEKSIKQSKKTDSQNYAVLFLDLDNFKVINDSLGHLAGDQLLIKISQRLKLIIKATDIAARLGGDEFVILLKNVDNIQAVMSCIDCIFEAFKSPLETGENNVFISTSIGVVFGESGYTDPSEVLRDADIALYRAKDKGKNRHEIFDVSMHSKALERMRLDNDLRRAIKQGEFQTFYQPIVALDTGSLIGFETLIRWQHPSKGLILPGDFISAAEETGLVTSIDKLILQSACQQLASWHRQFPEKSNLKVSVNLSSQTLQSEGLLEMIDETLRETGLKVESLVLEITENVLIENIDKAIELLSRLRTRGIKISIDDFGTGYSSLNYLCSLPANILKIDKSFITKMQDGCKNYQVVQAIISLGKQLNLETIAEGVETLQQLEWLKAMGCENGQGYLFSRPVDAEAAIKLVLKSVDIATTEFSVDQELKPLAQSQCI